MTPAEILNIADANGFDWFGVEHRGYLYRTINKDIFITEVLAEESEDKEDWGTIKSLSDLATNESFLEALHKANGYQCKGCPDCGNKDCGGSFGLQMDLIHNITNNDGKDFWEICGQFIGEVNAN